MPRAGSQRRVAENRPSKQRLRLWLRLLRSTRFMEGELRERLRVGYGVTLPRFDVLAALFRFEAGMTMTELSRLLMVSNGNVTGIVDRLVRDGHVVRVPDEQDRRATFVRLTAKGRAFFEEMAETHEGWVDEILAAVSPGDTDKLISLLERLPRGNGTA
ncbi:MAG: MarR family transcriptional regulator [Kiloniellales bacterium]|nr:MarR family transcriptional regulator [Kiloniellales bacterium]